MTSAHLDRRALGAAVALLLLATSCETGPERTAPAASPNQQQAYSPGAYGNAYGSPAAPAWQPPPPAQAATVPSWLMPSPAASAPPAPSPPAQTSSSPLDPRRIDPTLDLPDTRGVAAPDLRDPWARDGSPPRDVAARSSSLPGTNLLVLLSLDAKGASAARLAATRKALVSRGGVKRAESVWEIPTQGSDRTPEIVRAALAKTLCDEDRATLFFASGGDLVKLELGGDAPCDAAPK